MTQFWPKGNSAGEFWERISSLIRKRHMKRDLFAPSLPFLLWTLQCEEVMSESWQSSCDIRWPDQGQGDDLLMTVEREGAKSRGPV